MILQESNMYAHTVLWCAGFVLLFIIFLHLILRSPNEVGDNYKDDFIKQGISQSDIESLSHDDEIWYYKNIPTCVAYAGKYTKKCNKNTTYCGGGDIVGTPSQQAQAILQAIKNDGIHPLCPLIIS